MVNFIDGETKLNANNMNKLQADLIAEIFGEAWKKAELVNAAETGSGYGGATGVQYKKIGNHVFVKGSVSATWDGSTATKLCTLPEGYRPKLYNFSINAVTGSRFARIQVKPDGTVNIEWLRNLNDGSPYTQNAAWLDVSIDFWIDVE